MPTRMERRFVRYSETSLSLHLIVFFCLFNLGTKLACRSCKISLAFPASTRLLMRGLK